jgi:hypothetical protein
LFIDNTFGLPKERYVKGQGLADYASANGITETLSFDKEGLEALGGLIEKARRVKRVFEVYGREAIDDELPALFDALDKFEATTATKRLKE